MNLLFYSLVCGVSPDTGLRAFPRKRHRRMYFFSWHSCCTEYSPHCAAFCYILANYAWKKKLIHWLLAT